MLSNYGAGEETLEDPLDWSEINPEYSLKRLMLKLKLQYLGHLMGRADSLEQTLMLGNGKSRLTGTDLDAGEDWEQEEKGVAEDEVAG